MAVVTSSDGAMAHIRELFDDEEGALLLNRQGLSADEQDLAFQLLLSRLIEDGALCRRLGETNYERATVGALSAERRDRVLERIYDRALGDPAAGALDLRALPWSASTCRRTLTSGQVIAAAERCKQAAGIEGNQFVLNIEL